MGLIARCVSARRGQAFIGAALGLSAGLLLGGSALPPLVATAPFGLLAG